MLTCACGARFEVEESLAGQEVLCPECQQPLKVPAREKGPLLTSGYALASIVLALVGAFTLLGTFLAVILGAVALVQISRNRERLTGAGFAVFGIVLGLVFTGLTLFSFTTTNLFGLSDWMRERTTAEEVDTSGPLEVMVAAKGFVITRPTTKWGRVPNNRSSDPLMSDLQRNLDLLLEQVARNAFIDVRRQPVKGFVDLEQYEHDVLAEFTQHQPANPLDDDDDDFPQQLTRVTSHQSRRLAAAPEGVEGREMTVEVRRNGQPWRFLIRLYRQGNGPVYIVRAYAHKRRFDLVQAEVQAALDSFHIWPR
jgi:hypothetical protein